MDEHTEPLAELKDVLGHRKGFGGCLIFPCTLTSLHNLIALAY